jgi:dihydrofolate reductase
MRKLIAAMNLSLDDFCDHTEMTADEEIHHHYTDLLNKADTVIYGRVTYQLMACGRPFVEKPSGEKDIDEFAAAIDNIHKIVYSRTLKAVGWRNTELKKEIDNGEILELKKRLGKDILVGSPSLNVHLGDLGLIDEYQLGIQPTVIGRGLPLFKKHRQPDRSQASENKNVRLRRGGSLL